MEEKYNGWIEGFGFTVTNQLGQDIKDKIVSPCKSCQAISNDKEMSRCIKEIMNKFDEVVPEKEKRYSVMESMGNYCYNAYFAKNASEMKKKSKNVEEMIQNLNKSMGSDNFIIDGDKLLVSLDQCACQVGVKEAEEPISITYCNCSLGFMKELAKLIFDKPMEVELLESIVSGGETCRFSINIK